MEVILCRGYTQISKEAAEETIKVMGSYDRPLICVASGDSPAGIYEELVKRVKAGQLNVDSWNFVSLDEWAGLNGDDEGSCRYHLNNQLFVPLNISKEKLCFFNGRNNDLEAECSYVEDFIKVLGGIDVAIVGLGLNGHVGMNEPGTSPSLRSHVTAIDPVTEKTGQKYFKEQKKLTQGVTLGIANIMEAKDVILVVNGKHKAAIVQQVLEGEISEAVPASLLRNHSNLKVYLDEEAASMLRLSE